MKEILIKATINKDKENIFFRKRVEHDVIRFAVFLPSS